MRALSHRAAAAGVPLGAWLNASLPEATAIGMRIAAACLTLVGVIRLRAVLDAAP